MRHDDQRRRARSDERHGDVPAAHAQLQGRRRRSTSSRGGATAFPVIKDLVVESQRARSHHRGGRLRQRARPAARGRQRDLRSRSRTRTARWTPRRASAAARASRRARTARRRSSRRRRSRTSGCCRRVSRSATVARCAMVAQMDAEGFGHCTLFGECQEACPKEISIDTIARMNRDYRGGDAQRARGKGRSAGRADARARSEPRGRPSEPRSVQALQLRQRHADLPLVLAALVLVRDLAALPRRGRTAPARCPRSRRSWPAAASCSRSRASRSLPTPARTA